MKFVMCITAALLSPSFLLAAGTSNHTPLPSPSRKLVNTSVRTPLAFEPNHGQTSSQVRWISKTADRTFFLTADEAVMLLTGGGKTSTVRMKVVGSNPAASTEGLEKLGSTSNYFLGNNPSDWHTGVPRYAKVRYNDVYPGIDLVYYNADRRLEYDFVLAPGADPSRIELAYEGADRMHVDRSGDLVLQADGRTMRQLRPKIYQWIDGRQQEIAGSYRISGRNRVEFALAKYDRKRELVIDPVLQYSTYLGQEGRDVAVSVATDANGDIYMTGQTTSVRFPTGQKAQSSPGGKLDAFIAKFTGSGDLLWTSYLGGTENEVGRSIAVDAAGNSYIVGTTSSENFPTRGGTTSEFRGVWDAFLTKVSPDGQQFLYSTYIGGSGYDDAYAVAVDADANAYIAGQTLSPDFPVRGGFQTGPAGGGADTFVIKIATSRQSVIYSTYVGGNGIDVATGIAIDSLGNAYVAGYTTSTIFPLMAPIQGTRRGPQDAFLYKLNAAGNSLIYSTYIGGSDEDLGYRVALDPQNAAYLYGYTKSTDFPVRSAFQSTLGGKIDAFVTKISPAGDAIIYATYLGGNDDDIAFGNIAVDGAGTAYVSGYTASTNFPSRNPVQASYGGGKYDTFVARIGPQGNSLLYSTYIGGSGQDEAYGLAMDRAGQIVFAGGTNSANFPQARNAYTTTGGEFDIFLARLSSDASVNFVTPSTSALTFAVRQGTDPATQTIALSSGSAPVTFTAGSNQTWLRVSPESGTTPATLTVSVAGASVPAGASSATITINAPAAANSPITVPVTLNVTAAPVVTSASPNPVPRSSQDTVVTFTGSGFQNNLSVRVNGSPVDSSFVNATTVRGTIPAAVLASAQSPLQVVVVNADATQSGVFALPVGTPGPVIAANGIVNAASNISGPVAAGEILTIFGTGFGPDTPVTGSFVSGMLQSLVSDTRVLVDGVAAPIVSVAPNQVSAIVPYAVLGRESVGFEVEYKGQRSASVRLNVGAAAPGIFTQGNTGAGNASAFNQDGSVNNASNAAPVGSIITIFGTGEGLSVPVGADGRQVTDQVPKPVQTVTATIGGVAAVVEYAGGSPSTVAGLLQVNLRIPAGVTPGPAVPIVLSIAGVNSREGVTIGIR